jgi:hypothetical protein
VKIRLLEYIKVKWNLKGRVLVLIGLVALYEEKEEHPFSLTSEDTIRR